MPSNNPFNLPPESEALRQQGLALLEQARQTVPPAPPWWKFWGSAKEDGHYLLETISSVQAKLGAFEEVKAHYRNLRRPRGLITVGIQQRKWGDINGARDTLMEATNHICADLPTHSSEIGSLLLLSSSLNDVGAYDRAVEVANLTRIEGLKIRDVSQRSTALIDVASHQHTLGRTETTLEILAEVESIAGGLDEEMARGHSSILSSLASTYLQIGKPEEAERLLDQIPESYEHHIGLLISLVRFWKKKGEIERALAWAWQIPASYTRYQILFQVATDLAFHLDIEKALAISEDCSADCHVEQWRSIIWCNGARALLNAGRLAEGKNHLEEAWKTAREIPNQELRDYQLYRIAQDQVSVGEYETAQRTYNAISEEMRADLERSGDIRRHIATHQISQGEYAAVWKTIEAIESLRGQVYPLLALVRHAVESGKHEEAYRVARQALVRIQGLESKQDRDNLKSEVGKLYWQLDRKYEWQVLRDEIADVSLRAEIGFHASLIQARRGQLDDAIARIRAIGPTRSYGEGKIWIRAYQQLAFEHRFTEAEAMIRGLGPRDKQAGAFVHLAEEIAKSLIQNRQAKTEIAEVRRE